MELDAVQPAEFGLFHDRRKRLVDKNANLPDPLRKTPADFPSSPPAYQTRTRWIKHQAYGVRTHFRTGNGLVHLGQTADLYLRGAASRRGQYARLHIRRARHIVKECPAVCLTAFPAEFQVKTARQRPPRNAALPDRPTE